MRSDDDLPKAFTDRTDFDETQRTAEERASLLERSRHPKQRPKTTGVYVHHFLDDEDRPTFERLIERLHEDFEFNCSSDLMQVELVAVYFLRLARAQRVADFDAAQKLDQMIRAHLRDLKTTKLAREADQPKGPETTPAEWATRVLETAEAEPGGPGPSGPPLDVDEEPTPEERPRKRKSHAF